MNSEVTCDRTVVGDEFLDYGSIIFLLLQISVP